MTSFSSGGRACLEWSPGMGSVSVAKRTISGPPEREKVPHVRAAPRLRGLPVFGFGVAGLLLGHTISYLLAIPDPYHRDLLLQRTGHDYLPLAFEAGLVLLLAGVATLLARAWSACIRDEGEGFASLAGRLALVQVGAFVGQEIIERLVAGSPLGGLARDHVLSIGVVIQITLALVGAAVLPWLARASARIVRAVVAARDTPIRAALVSATPVGADHHTGRVVASDPNVRAPPPA